MTMFQPPPSFAEFESYETGSYSNNFHSGGPPPVAPSGDLFSASETTDLLGFLDNFNDWGGLDSYVDYEHQGSGQNQDFLPPRSNPSPKSLSPYPTASSNRNRPTSRRGSGLDDTPRAHLDLPLDPPEYDDYRPGSSSSRARSSSPSSSRTPPAAARNASTRAATVSASAVRTAKPLLSTPQKRLNHIMSEQKRRNAIRDGYAQLIGLLAPAGSAPGLGMPTRGRPKGSGSRGKGRSKGKSGVLFRAVEYCKWLEEGRDALQSEVERLEHLALDGNAQHYHHHPEHRDPR